MAKVRYIESPCKAALNRVRGMPFAWSLNPYRGCTHGCHYCYARASHAYLGHAASDFETTIYVKTNLPEALESELDRPTWRGERVAIGTATDPYQPCEGRYRLTRRALELLAERRNPFSLVTKSTLVIRDRDLLAELAREAEVTVYVTVTTLDPALWRATEPGTPPPLKRLAVMERLVESGVPCGVFLAPILPGLTDSSRAIETVAEAARAHGASSFGASLLRLAPLVKEHYLGFVGESFPGLAPRYERAYTGTNAPLDYRRVIEARVDRARELAGFPTNAMRHREGPPLQPRRDPALDGRQLALGL
jgi:DNA repair photolyase